jgi:hypothetical protein
MPLEPPTTSTVLPPKSSSSPIAVSSFAAFFYSRPIALEVARSLPPPQ